MIKEIKQDGEARMQKTLEALESTFSKVRTGRAHPGMLSGVMVSYYGSPTPLNQVASVNVEDSRTLLVQPFERTMVQAIDKAIREADLGLNPMTADVIRVPMPALTEETRKKMSKARVGRKPMLGKHHSEETRKRISKALKGKPQPWNSKTLLERRYAS